MKTSYLSGCITENGKHPPHDEWGKSRDQQDVGTMGVRLVCPICRKEMTFIKSDYQPRKAKAQATGTGEHNKEN